MAGKPRKGGRVTPKKQAPAAPAADGDATPQVGKRPSSPAFLFGVSGLWIAAGALIWYSMSATWKLIPAIFAIGVGLFFLRGALQTVVRHDERLDEPED